MGRPERDLGWPWQTRVPNTLVGSRLQGEGPVIRPPARSLPGYWSLAVGGRAGPLAVRGTLVNPRDRLGWVSFIEHEDQPEDRPGRKG
jgi:hypothetical protein